MRWSDVLLFPLGNTYFTFSSENWLHDIDEEKRVQKTYQTYKLCIIMFTFDCPTYTDIESLFVNTILDRVKLSRTKWLIN